MEISINSIFFFLLFFILLSNFLSYFSTSSFLDGNTLHSLCSIKHPIVKAPSLCCPTRDDQFKTISRTTSIHVIHPFRLQNSPYSLTLSLAPTFFFYSGSLILLCMSGFEQHVFYGDFVSRLDVKKRGGQQARREGLKSWRIRTITKSI